LSLTGLLILASLSGSVQAAAPPTVRRDEYGDPLPPGAVIRIGTTRLRHAADVRALAFSPDGRRISSATIEYDTAVWDARTGRSLVFRNSDRGKRLYGAAVSPDGSLFAGRTETGELGVQEALGGRILHRLGGSKAPCDGLVFSRDNRWLASGDRDGNTWIWDLRSGKSAHRFKFEPRDGRKDFWHAFTPDGKTFIRVRVEDITFYDVQTGKEKQRIRSKKKDEWPTGVAVSPDGKLLAVRSCRDRVDLREVDSGRFVRTIVTGTDLLLTGAVGPVFSPDGKHIVTATEKGEICFQEVATEKRGRTLKGPPEERPTGFAFSPDGKLLACGGSDHAIHLWDLASGKERFPVKHRLGGRPWARFLADGKTILIHCRAGNRKWVTLHQRLSCWDLQGNFLREIVLQPGGWLLPAWELSGDGRTVAYGIVPNDLRFGRSRIQVWDEPSGRLIAKVDLEPCHIYALTFSPDGRFLLVKADKAGWNPDDHHRVDTLQIWKRKRPTGLEKVADIPLRSFLSGYCVSVDSRWVVVTARAGYRVYDCETGKLLRTCPDAAGSVIAMPPSGRVLLSRAEDGPAARPVVVRERATGKPICELECKSGQNAFPPLAMSPDGRFVAGCLDEQAIVLWDAFTGKQVGRLMGHRGDIRSLVFSPDGRFLLSASDDTTVLVWDWRKKLPKSPGSDKLSSERLEQLWRDLEASAPQRAYRAIAALVRSPGPAVDLLRKKLRRANTDQSSRIKRWIDDLDSDSYRVREAATRELIRSAELAEEALRRALAGGLSAEARRRATRVLDELPAAAPHPSTLVTIRSLEVLELIYTPEARKLITELSRQTADPIRKREAAETLQRVSR
jgi:WD40 repeat protein